MSNMKGRRHTRAMMARHKSIERFIGSLHVELLEISLACETGSNRDEK